MGGRSWRAPSGSRRTWRAGSSTGRSTSSSRGPRSEKKSHLPTYLIIHVPHTRGGEGCRESPPVRQGASAFPPLSGLLSPPLLLPSMLYPSRSLGALHASRVIDRERVGLLQALLDDLHQLGCGGLHARLHNDVVNQPVLLGLRSRHEVVAVRVQVEQLRHHQVGHVVVHGTPPH